MNGKTVNRAGRKIFDFLEVHLAAFIFFVLILTIAVQVFSRYVLSRPLPRVFELSVYSFVWVIYLGACFAKRFNKHIRFDIIYRKFSKKIQCVIDIIFDAAANIVLVLLLAPSIQYTIINYPIKSSALRVPWTYLLLCFPLFVLLILVHNTLSIYDNIQSIRGKRTEAEEDVPWD